jgi:alpha-galactosidase
MFGNMNIIFNYYKGEQKHKEIFNSDYKNSDFTTNVTFKSGNNFKKLKVSIIPTNKIEIEGLYLSMDFKFKASQRIFVNGYQSWTDSREFFIDEKIKSISKLVAPVMKKYQFHKYGDYIFKKYSKKSGEFHGYTYSYIREGEYLDLIGSLYERSGYTIIEEYVKENKIIINKECKGLNINDEYIAFELVWIRGTEEGVFDKYFELMDIKKTQCRPMTGWTNWYNYYQDINQTIILQNLKNFKAFNKKIDIFQIDDGYQTYVGDWLSVDKKKFPKGMKYIADSIKENGYKAGIWLAPFVCETNSEIFKNKKKWILTDEKGDLVLAGSNWSRFYALDFYNTEVRDYIKKYSL